MNTLTWLIAQREPIRPDWLHSISALVDYRLRHAGLDPSDENVRAVLTDLRSEWSKAWMTDDEARAHTTPRRVPRLPNIPAAKAEARARAKRIAAYYDTGLSALTTPKKKRKGPDDAE
jgi:hypothetical protein